MIQHFGIRGHDLQATTTDEILKELHRLALDGVQLAPLKAYPLLKNHDAFFETSLAEEVATSFHAQGKTILLLGCYLNHAHPEASMQEEFLRITKGYLRAAVRGGISCVATESFTLHRDGKPHPKDHTEEGYQRLLRQMEPILELAETLGVSYAVEGAAHHIVHDIATMKRLTRDLQSPNLKLIFDPVNLMTEDLAKEQERFFYEYLEAFEFHTQAVHLKDFIYREGKKDVITAGEGSLSYDKLFPLLEKSKKPLDILLEGVAPDLIEKAVRFMKQGGR